MRKKEIREICLKIKNKKISILGLRPFFIPENMTFLIVNLIDDAFT